MRVAVLISIHVPREGDDCLVFLRPKAITIFQSTSPVRGTTKKWADRMLLEFISIHVPREGDDEIVGEITCAP